MTKTLKPGMRLLCLLLCAVSLLSLVRPVSAKEQTPAENQTLTTLVRMDPRDSAVVIGQMENGAVVTVLGTKGNFYKVDCYDMTGYIAKSQIEHTDDKYYVNCKEGSSETKILTYTDHAAALEMRHSLLALAKKQLRSRYVYGGMRPGAFDCSGLTSYLYKQHGISLHRRASLQLQDGIIVPKEAMQVGDLVFFRESKRYPATHVGIYAGNNQIIHASTSGGVTYDSLDVRYCVKYFLCVRRMINTQAVQTEPLIEARTQPVPLTVASISGRTAR